MPPSEALDPSRLRPALPSPLQPAEDDRFARHGVRLLLKRDDLIHPDLPGNKWRKLSPNLRATAGRTVLTFGGAYSNHLRATAAAACSGSPPSGSCAVTNWPTAPSTPRSPDAPPTG